MTRRNQHYPPELRERAVRMVFEVTPNYDSQWAAINAVAQKLGVGTAETVRKWVRQAEIDTGHRAGVSSDESAEIKRLKREVAELRRANDPESGLCFLRGRARPARDTLVRFIAAHADHEAGGLRWGVETPDPNGGQAATSAAVLADGFGVAGESGKARCSS